MLPIENFPLDISLTLAAISLLTFIISSLFFSNLLKRKKEYLGSLEQKSYEAQMAKPVVSHNPSFSISETTVEKTLNEKFAEEQQRNAQLADDDVNSILQLNEPEAPIQLDDLLLVEGVGPKISELLNKNKIFTFDQLSQLSVENLQSILDQAGSHYQMHNPASWPQQAKLAAEGRWTELSALKTDLKSSQLENGMAEAKVPVQINTQKQVDLNTPSSIDLKSINEIISKNDETNEEAPQETNTISESDIIETTENRQPIHIQKDDLKLVEGIGVKIQEILNAKGVFTFKQLAEMSALEIKNILDAEGSKFQMHDPTTWPQQAALARDGEWPELKRLQDVLDKGRPA